MDTLRQDRAAPPDTVLVIDDDIAVRLMLARMVRRLGLQALTASDGYDGLHLLAQYADHIACVLLSLSMQRVSGVETFQRLRTARPEVPIIITSGAGDAALQPFLAQPQVFILPKPFALQQLHRLLDQALGR
jgi:DNA-binding NtrC family response regulator